MVVHLSIHDGAPRNWGAEGNWGLSPRFLGLRGCPGIGGIGVIPSLEEHPLEPCSARPGGRDGLRGLQFWCANREQRGSCLQHLDHWLPGDLHGSVLLRPDRGADEPADRQLRGERRRQRGRAALHRRSRGARFLGDSQQLAVRGERGAFPGEPRPSGGLGDRHAEAGAPPAEPRSDARGPVGERGGPERTRGESQAHPFHAGAGPGDAGLDDFGV